MYEIVVSAESRVEPGVWQTLHGNDIEDGNIVGKNMVPSEKKIEVPGICDVHMKEKLTGMYPRVSSSATKNWHRDFQYSTHSGFQYLLYAWFTWLPLPSAVATAFISYVNKISQRVGL